MWGARRSRERRWCHQKRRSDSRFNTGRVTVVIGAQRPLPEAIGRCLPGSWQLAGPALALPKASQGLIAGGVGFVIVAGVPCWADWVRRLRDGETGDGHRGGAVGGVALPKLAETVGTQAFDLPAGNDGARVVPSGGDAGVPATGGEQG
jgi:hypothetical protein